MTCCKSVHWILAGCGREANENPTYTLKNAEEGTEFELAVHTDILDTEYPVAKPSPWKKAKRVLGT